MSSNDALSKIKECMKHYTSGKNSINNHQLDFLTEEVSRRLERVKKVERILELFVGMTPQHSLLDIPKLLEIMKSKDEIKNSLIKKLEENLSFLKNSKIEIENSLSTLFESWESYLIGNFSEAIKKAEESKSLVDKARKNCLIGISKETIRSAETKISTGKRNFAAVKDARKILDIAKQKFDQIDENPHTTLTYNDHEILEKIIINAKKAELEAQYAIDDAKAPFIVNIVAIIFAILGGIWGIYSALIFFRIL